MQFHHSNDMYWFPSIRRVPDDGLLAVGGDLKPTRLIESYSKGVFPWYGNEDPIMWWSPNPRTILKPGNMKVSKSLKKLIRDSVFEIRMDTNFNDVIKNCATVLRRGEAGTWINTDLMHSFMKLHEIGLAHSVETYREGLLVGGLYGLALGKVFFGESMFHLESNASKVALYHLQLFLNKNHFKLIDAQQETDHLKSLGAVTMPRKLFTRMILKYATIPNPVEWNTNRVRAYS